MYTSPEIPRPQQQKRKRRTSIPPPPGEQFADQEQFETFLDQRLLDAREHVEKINEGNNGVIFHLNIKELPDALRKSLEDCGLNLQGESVVKVLKIYTRGAGFEEFSMQQRAFDIVEESGREDLATVPRPILYRDLEVTDEIKEKLRRSGVQPADQAELILMDYVPADDIATHLFREIVRRHKKTTHLAADADRLTFDELADAVWDAFQFPREDRRKLQDDNWEQIRINTKRIQTFLENSDYQMNPDVLRRIKNTMDLFHDNGFAFRDGHHRNFLVRGGVSCREGVQAEPCAVSVIDFGASREFRKGEKIVYEEEVAGVMKRYPDDYGIIKSLEPLTLSPSERAKAPIKQARGEIEALKEKLEKRSAPWRTFRDMLIAQAESGSPDYERLYHQAPSSPNRLNNFLAAVSDLITAKPERRREVIDFLQRKSAGVIPAERNQIVRFIQSL